VKRSFLVLALLAVAIVTAPATAGAACLPNVRWHDHRYFDAQVKQAVGLGAPVSGGRARCIDYRDGTSAPVALRRIAGVPARVALARDATNVELAEGFPLELPAHPLHAALGVADNPSAASCAKPRTIRGRTRYLPSYGAGFVVYRPNAKRVQLELSSATRYRGTRRLGIPYVAKRSRVRATGCMVTRYGRFKMLAVSSVRVRRP
jgi:hypothetical protein